MISTNLNKVQNKGGKKKEKKKVVKPGRTKYILLATFYKTSIPPALPLWCLLKQGRRTSPRLLGSKI